MRFYRSASIDPVIIFRFVTMCLMVVFVLSAAAVAAERKAFDPITEILLGDHAVNRDSFGFVPQPGGKKGGAPKPTCALSLTVNQIHSEPYTNKFQYEVLVTVPKPFREEITEVRGDFVIKGGIDGLDFQNKGNGQWKAILRTYHNGQIEVFPIKVGVNQHNKVTAKVKCLSDIITMLKVPAFAEIGKPVTCNLTISGGTPPYSAEIFWGDGSTSSLSNIESQTVVFSHTYQKEDSVAITGKITDSLKTSSFANGWIEVVAPLTVEINGPPVRYTGEDGTWVATTTGGYRPKVVKVSIDDAKINTCADIHNAGSCAGTGSFSSAGTHRVTGSAVDKFGNMVVASMDVSVVEREMALSLTGPGILKGDSPGTFTATVTGGEPPYSFYFYYGDASWDGPFATSANTQTATHAYQKVGTFTPAARVEDSTGASVTANPVTVVVTCPDGYHLCSGECWPEDYQCCGNGACGGDFPVCCGNGCCGANSYCAIPGAGLCCLHGTVPVPGAGPGGYICCSPGLVACDDGVSCCYSSPE